MSEFAEDMEAMREYQKKKRAANLKTNSELILFLAGLLDFKAKVLHETQVQKKSIETLADYKHLKC